MNVGIELAYEPLASEILQLKLLFWEMADLLPPVVIYGIPFLFGLVWLLAALDCVWSKEANLSGSHDKAREEELHGAVLENQHSQPPTRFPHNVGSAAA